MNTISNHEIEVKFHIQDHEAIKNILIEHGAILIQPRTHEYNLRFDTANNDLIRRHEVLRLRRDTISRLTFKGPASVLHGVSSRPEYEFSVSDFEAARKFVEALGYQVAAIYEKHRTTYELGPVKIMLDEMPYGKFLEIEGREPEALKTCAELLNLNWDAALSESYMELFKRFKSSQGHIFRDLTFENFKDIKVELSELRIQYADQHSQTSET